MQKNVEHEMETGVKRQFPKHRNAIILVIVTPKAAHKFWETPPHSWRKKGSESSVSK